MKIKLDWLHTDSIKETSRVCSLYNISFSIEIDSTIPQIILEGSQSELHLFVFHYYNNVNYAIAKFFLTEEDFFDCVIKN